MKDGLSAETLGKIIADAERRGAEAERKEHAYCMEATIDALKDAAYRRGAEEMRELAARVADEKAAHYEKRSRHTPAELDIGAVTGCEAVADAIRALPLTPEEPA